MPVKLGSVNYLMDKLKLARKFGYKDPDLLIIAEYAKGKSHRQIGEMLDMTGNGIRMRANRLGLKARPRGGDNTSPGSRYRIKK